MFELISLVFDSLDSFTDLQIILTHLAYPITLLGDVGSWGTIQGCLSEQKHSPHLSPNPTVSAWSKHFVQQDITL